MGLDAGTKSYLHLAYTPVVKINPMSGPRALSISLVEMPRFPETK